MSIKLTILNATGDFNEIYDILEAESYRVIRLIEKYFSLTSMDITVSPISADEAPLGIAGFVISPCRVEIMVDTSRDDLLTVIRQDLGAVVAHEIHHVVRASSGVENKTLLQNVVAEGLACHFETKFNGNQLPSLFNDIQNQDWKQLYAQMQPALNSIEFSYPLYFGGEDESTFPNRAGYWVGFNLVSEYINQHGGCAVTLVSVSADRITNNMCNDRP